MNEHEFDRRVTAALRDAASSTPRNPAALEQIMRRARAGAATGAGSRRNVAVGLAAASLVAAGAVGVFMFRPDPDAAPAAASNGASTVEARMVPPTVPDVDDLPLPGVADSPLFYDDATLLAQLYTNFEVGDLAEASRTFNDSAGIELDAAGMADCLLRQGFEYFPDPPGSSTAWWTGPERTMAPADFAAQYGFGVAARGIGLLADDELANLAFSEYYIQLSPERQEAYNLASEQCWSEHSNFADRAHLFPSTAWNHARDHAFRQFQSLVVADSRVVAEMDGWRSCMASAGFVVDDPSTVDEQFHAAVFEYEPWNFPLTAGTPEYQAVEVIFAEEVAMATVHADCVVPYDAAVRQAITDHFPEYKSILLSAIESGVQSDAHG